MENVPEVIGAKNIEDFKNWELRLSKFGYTNYCEILNGKDYEIPQNRKRAYMISVLGEYAYDFPCKIKLKHRLKDFLEENVDEKWFLDDKTIERISKWNSQEKANVRHYFLPLELIAVCVFLIFSG